MLPATWTARAPGLIWLVVLKQLRQTTRYGVQELFYKALQSNAVTKITADYYWANSITQRRRVAQYYTRCDGSDPQQPLDRAAVPSMSLRRACKKERVTPSSNGCSSCGSELGREASQSALFTGRHLTPRPSSLTTSCPCDRATAIREVTAPTSL